MDNTKNAVEIFNKFARQYQDKFMDVSLYKQSLDLFCNSIAKQNAEVLELACGPGNITKYLLEKRPDLKILGTDLAPNMIALAKSNNPSAEFQLMDCRDIKQHGKRYDAIMCGFCLPYLSKVEAIKLISDASEALSNGGVLYISTMEDDHLKSGLKTSSAGNVMYMNYHEGDYLVEALKKNGFEILYLHRQDFPGEEKVTDLLIVGKK